MDPGTAVRSRTLIPHFSITVKLLVWCLLLVAIFYATTSFLLVKMRRIAALSDEVVNVHQVVEVGARQMVAHLQSFEQNRRTWLILDKERFRANAIANLDAYGNLLQDVRRALPEPLREWEDLARDYESVLYHFGRNEMSISGEVVADWLARLAEIRYANSREAEALQLQIDRQGRDASNTGLYGLIASICVGLGGSAFIAWRLNLSLSAIRRGIRSVGGEGEAEPVQVSSRDELGELARAFNEMAERLKHEERMRTDFISMLSHEIRTPLTSIRESVNMVADGVFGEVNEKQQRFLALSRKEIERLSELLTRLMQVSSLESGRLKLSTEAMDLRDLVQAVQERVTPAAVAKEIEVAAELPGEPVMAEVDRSHLQQALLNLAGNAVKFSPKGSLVRIMLSQDREAGEAVLCVRDQGPGVPEKDRPHVFQKYYRGADVRDAVDGAGLGLSITMQIVRAHGGRLWLKDCDGPGSCFCFALPSKGLNS